MWWRHLPIAGKLAVWLVLSTGVSFLIFGAITLKVQRRGDEELVLQAADRIGDVIKRSTRYQMLHNDRAALYQMVRDIGSEPGIARIRIFNGEGRISFSTDVEEVGQVVNKQAEACYACHAQAEPLTKLARPDRARIFSVDGNHRVLGVIRPIENEPSCSQAACHAHPAGQRVLGVIDSQLRLDSVDSQSAAQEHLLRLTSLAGVLLICLLSVAFIWVFVHRPIRDLRRGTHRVAAGDLKYRLTARSNDELGELVNSFNTMTDQLAEARSRLEAGIENKTRQLEKAQIFLEGSEKMASLGKLAATVAHEVNNPLFGILTYARLGLKSLEAAPDDLSREKAVQSFRVIERESRRCGDIMRNLLTFARQAPSDRSPQSVNELVSRAVTLVRHQLDLQSVALETDYARDLPEIPCDAGQIQQVILVLLINALEAMPQGGSLHVSTARDPLDGVRIVVRDTGGGIKAEVLPKIFEPFFTTKEDVHRTGMGLAVARSILEQHGGSIQARSQEGGAEFTVRLPVMAYETHE
jgi:two-component system NtrC family sensor kinase